MSKKTLLNETQVRRFMKLATLGKLSDGFVDGLNEAGYFTDVDEPTIAEEEEDALDDLEDEAELPGDEGPEDAAAPEAELGDMGDMDDMGGMGDAAGESLPPEVVAKVEDALAAALGAMEQELEDAIPELDLSVEQDGGEEVDLGPEEPAGGDMDFADEEGGLGEDPEPEGMEGEEGGMGDMELELQESELIERIVRRVAQRIRTTNKD